MEPSVITYGGGEILRNVFNAVAMLMNNGNGSLFKPLMIIASSIAVVWGLSRAFFSSSTEAILGKIFLPFILITGLLLIPSTTIKIEDKLTKKHFSVDHVPFFLAHVAEVISTIGYHITSGFELAMHGIRDPKYEQTGMIFGAESVLEISQYKVTNANLERNLRSFAQNCVLYDVALKRYSIDDLKKSGDLLQLFKDKTSDVRSILYCPIDLEDSTGEFEGGKCNIISCKAAMTRMEKYLNNEKEYYVKNELFKNLPVTLQMLKNLHGQSKDQFTQLILMNSLKGSFKGGKDFAKARAYAQQKSTYHILGSLAAKSLVTMRAVLEALVYAAFLFVMPAVLLPGGFKFFGNWLWLVAWLQMWPSFFVILDSIMQTIAAEQVSGVLAGLAPSEQGLSFFTSIGLKNIQEDIYALSGYLCASIPFISYAVIQGGASSFMHLAGAMMTPAHTAAASAAVEQVTGNYSYGNLNYDNQQVGNAGFMHKNMSPMLSNGYSKFDSGHMTSTHTDDGRLFVHQNSSQLLTGLSQSDSLNQAMEMRHQEAFSTNETARSSYMENMSQTSRDLINFSQHLANDSSFAENLSKREEYNMGESGNYMESTIRNFSEQHGITETEAANVLLGASYFGSGGNYNIGAQSAEVYQDAQNISQSSEFRTHMQRMTNAAKHESFNETGSEGSRLATDLSASVDEMKSSQKAFDVSSNELSQVSNMQQLISSSSQAVQRNLNQSFVDWGGEEYGQARLIRAIESDGKELRGMHVEFLGQVEKGGYFTSAFDKLGGSYHEQSNDLSAFHQQSSEGLRDSHERVSSDSSILRENYEALEGDIRNTISEGGLERGDVKQSGHGLHLAYEGMVERVNSGMDIDKSDVGAKRKLVENLVREKQGSSVIAVTARAAGDRVDSGLKAVFNHPVVKLYVDEVMKAKGFDSFKNKNRPMHSPNDYKEKQP